ncbi:MULTISPECIES: hybrid sensor histidine kinase/response regulator [Rhizobium]|uniref:histidine kinase n=1 Tax=Rhizobium rhododendri TaxID=2506430 RepID=A0ABY8IRY8_9HYPH|nr:MULTISPECIES: PAS domain-containing protein [Rhizobium]MBZ5759469.1 PAS domain-containing protein [Rhizobium sp. VS19-DR96]MBZ5765798.1 PAS domain-containing protein [Rhizobium sp. VS19-DR129.2]MBZ5773882.1 PAS domain-containing protein [Rhizobium sp. VS19-DRK62.2]MBZ5784954.1 PAS domain-containing protein [Rhizobium sp. VS19-DR121]MBZ5801969.1 PAS domain-containing protein [Rhizobium sp. VS19-DR181]
MAPRQSRNVSLTPELEAFIHESLATGDYANASEVVRAALCRLRDGAAVPATSSVKDWPKGGGECGALIRSMDWNKSLLGPIEGWSTEMRTTVANIVNSPVAKVLMWGRHHVMLYNDAYREIAGERHPSAFGTPVAVAFPEVWDWNRSILEAGLRGEIVTHRDQPIVFNRPDGPQTMFLDLFYTPVYDADGHVGGVMCTIVDNSARLLAETRLAEREAELRSVTDAVPMLISYVDQDHIYRFANGTYRDWFGVDPQSMVGRHVSDVIGEKAYGDRRQSIVRGLAGETFASEAQLAYNGGALRRIEIRYVPHFGADGAVLGVHILGIDVEERAQRETDLAVSNKRFRYAMDAVHGVLWTNSADGRMIGEQHGWSKLTGQTAEEYQGYGWSNAVHPDDAAATVEAWKEAVATKSMFIHEHRVRRHDGSWRQFAIRGLPILDASGDIVEWVGVHTDITHQRAAEAALREQAEVLSRQVRHRERAEEQLRQVNENLEARVVAEIGERRAAEAKLAQAQKMETVGKLTGGVAHDFNNLLQVVSGNLQLLARDIAGNPRAETRVANAMAGVSRGSKLASQLLAFGRRQALEPKVVNISRFVRGMDDMLRRAIGEAIEVETVVTGGLWNTFIDPAQVENALLNLAINARDAMAGRGKLTIELANAHLDDSYALEHDEVTPGQYVMLAVSDTGTGMSPDIIDKVFEPFFSTKAEGKGSGLGLSMVYGFVKQSGGHVKIYSEVGEGTTIKLYLPRAMQSEDMEVAVDTGPITGGTETVLVVEDDDAVRDTVVNLLTDLGYRVLKAIDAASALSVIESGIPIDILFTDVVMPGTLKSPELARKARERLPDIAILFTSGYTENSIVHGGKLDAGIELLSKPYTREAMARKFRHVLANRSQRLKPAESIPASNPSLEAPASSASVTTRLTVLLVEDDNLIRVSTGEALKNAGCIVVEAGSAEEAMAALETVPFDVLVTDVNLPGASGAELAKRARSVRPSAAIVFATGDPSSVKSEIGAVVVGKPYHAEALIAAVERSWAAVSNGASAETETSPQQSGRFSNSTSTTN